MFVNIVIGGAHQKHCVLVNVLFHDITVCGVLKLITFGKGSVHTSRDATRGGKQSNHGCDNP